MADILVKNQRLKRDVQCECSKGDKVHLKQGDYVRSINKHWLPRDHHFLRDNGYNEKLQIVCLSAYGMVLIYRSDLDGL